jgi:hypothetical protein
VAATSGFSAVESAADRAQAGSVTDVALGNPSEQELPVIDDYWQRVPTMYVAMLNAGSEVADTSTLRICVSGGAALPAEVTA